ncbi:MAG: hypothetical protein LBP67_00175 [Bacteroidales bacterium]|jgi:hypothetical protein|nr:hypothetical protein [Bacteroidales bacterium]
MSKVTTKPEVFNSIDLFNTVGMEIEEIVDAHNRDKEALLDILSWSDFGSITKVKTKELKILSDYLELGEVLINFLTRFQKDYAIQEKKSKKSFKDAKSKFHKLKDIQNLLNNEFNEGIDQLDDIIDFFGVESIDDIFNFQYNSPHAMFKEQVNSECNLINLHGWLRRGELEFKKNENLSTYNKYANGLD